MNQEIAFRPASGQDGTFSDGGRNLIPGRNMKDGTFLGRTADGSWFPPLVSGKHLVLETMLFDRFL